MLIPSRCIFFHETTCSPPNLTPRQACAVESAARNNRNLNVFLLFFATGQLSEKSKRFVEILETYDNVYLRMVRLSSYIIDTPIEDWFWTNIRRYWGNYDWLRKDFHDYIRMLTLWKFGGVTLNLNSVVLAWVGRLFRIFKTSKRNLRKFSNNRRNDNFLISLIDNFLISFSLTSRCTYFVQKSVRFQNILRE